MKKILYSLDNIEATVHEFMQDTHGAQVITFTGGLGAGKTTFIRHMAQYRGIHEVVTSPTFTYFNVYHAADGQIIYHFDLYRIKTLAEFEAAGFFEYLYQPDSVAWIEWPEVVMPLLPRHVCHASLSVLETDRRLLSYTYSV